MTEFAKNQIVTLKITSVSNDGNGVGHADGMAVFVAGGVPGDVLEVRLAKLCHRYAFGVIERVVTPSPERLPPDCAVCRSCGGCDFRTMRYGAELAAKRSFVQDAMTRLAGFSLPVLPVLPSPEENGYRNKVQYPLTRLPDGRAAVGFYAGRSHRVVPCSDCRLQPPVLNEIAQTICRLLDQYNMPLYREETGSGLVRHLYLRRGAHSKEIMVCLVCTAPALPRQTEFLQALLRARPEITTVLLNLNAKKTNIILGEKSIVLHGPGYIRDTLCGVPVTLDPLAFYQVNTPAAENVYRIAARLATLPLAEVQAQAAAALQRDEPLPVEAPPLPAQPQGLLLDLYCGAGAIGLSMAGQFAELLGVETVPQAVENARTNAAAMGIAPEKARFICADAGTAAAQLAAEGLQPRVVVVDPPRKGCDVVALQAVLRMAPGRIVMISCNPATAARDLRFLAENGYTLHCVQPADFFARTRHVECVAMLSRKEAAL